MDFGAEFDGDAGMGGYGLAGSYGDVGGLNAFSGGLTGGGYGGGSGGREGDSSFGSGYVEAGGAWVGGREGAYLGAVPDVDVTAPSSGRGLSLGGSGIGLSAGPGAGLALAAPNSVGITPSGSQMDAFGPSIASAPSLDVGTAAMVAGAAASLAMRDAENAARIAAEEKDKAQRAQTAARSVANVIPGGGFLMAVIDAASSVVSAIFGNGSMQAADPSPSIATSAPSSLFAGGDGPTTGGFSDGAPVLGFAGAVVNTPQATSQTSGVASALFPGLSGYGPAGGGPLRSPAGFVTAPQATQSSAPLLLLAAGASLFFLR